MVELIILDVYGTLIKADSTESSIRPGLEQFLEYYREKKIVVFSDGEIETVEFDLNQAGLKRRLVKIYGAESLDQDKLKDLAKVAAEFNIFKTNTRFIGDNSGNKDYRSARRYGIPFTKIPQFRDRIPSPSEAVFDRHVKYAKKAFSFTSLIGKL